MNPVGGLARRWYVPDAVLLGELVGIHAILFAILCVMAYVMESHREPAPSWVFVPVALVLPTLVLSLRLAIRMTCMALLGTLVVVYALFFVIRHVVAYLAGLQREPLLSWIVVLTVLALLTLALSLGLLIRKPRTWPKHIADWGRCLMLRLLAVVGIAVFLALPFTRFGLPPHTTFIKAWKRYVLAEVDVEAIRAWLKTLDPNRCTGDYAYDPASGATIEDWWPEAAPWAKTITPLDPLGAGLALDSHGHPAIIIWWGDWGLVVGPQTMQVSPTHFSTHADYQLSLGPGAYVWHER